MRTRRVLSDRLLDDIFRETYAHYETPLAPDLLDTLKHTYRAHMREHSHDIRAFPGIVEMLDGLHERDIRLAIVTTKHRHMAQLHLQTSGLAAYFEFLVPGDEVTKPKPDAEPFLRALELLALPPSLVAHVGDSQHDITGAKAAGIYAIAALWGADNREALLAADPDCVVEMPEGCDALKCFAGGPAAIRPPARTG